MNPAWPAYAQGTWGAGPQNPALLPQAAPPPLPTVGGCVDMINALSDADRTALYGLLGLVPVAQALNAPVPPGYTRNPVTGRVYRLQEAAPVSADKARLDQAVKDAATALKAHAVLHGVTVVGGIATYPGGTAPDVRTAHEGLIQTLNAAKAAKAAYKAANPAEYGPAQVPKRGRGRGSAAGRGRATGGRGAAAGGQGP